MNCPTHETLAAYTDGRLPADERRPITEHLASCERCYEVFREVSIFAREEAPARMVAFRPRRRVVGALAAAAAIALIAVGVTFRLSSRRSRVERIAAAVGGDHAIAARLTGGFAPSAPTRSAAIGEENDALLREFLDAKRSAEEGSTDGKHALGVAQLLRGNDDAAIETLLDVAERSLDAEVWSDLAAAHLSRARRGGDALDASRALEAVERALEIDPSLAEALFNRALALEMMHQAGPAAGAYRDFLAVESSGAWADEARRRLSGLDKPSRSERWEREKNRLAERDPDATARDFAELARIEIEDEILPAWGSAFLRGDRAAAESNLAIAKRIGEALAKRGNPMIADAVQTIDAAGTARRSGLAEAHRGYGVARAHHRRFEVQRAAAQFRESESRLARAGSPFALNAIMYQASGKWAAADVRGCDEILDRLERAHGAGLARYPALAAQIAWMRGLIAVAGGDPQEAVVRYESALARFRALGERDHVAMLEGLVAEAFESVGDEERASRHRDLALATLAETGNTRRAQVVLNEAARAALELEQPRSALAYQSIALDLARIEGGAMPIAAALVWRSRVLDELRRSDGARRDLREARAFAARIDDSGIRERTFADLAVADALLARRDAPEVSIAALSSALEFIEKSGNYYHYPRLILERGRQYRRLGDAERAQRDFHAGLAHIAENRERLGDEALRIAYFENGEDLAEELTRLALAEQRVADAFDETERSRARALLDRVARAGLPRPKTSVEIARLLAPGRVLLAYAVHDDRTIIFAITSRGLQVAESPRGEGDIRRSVTDFVEKLRRRRPLAEVDRAAEEQYRQLLAPVEGSLATATSIVIVPDKMLHAVPFAALRDRGRYLAERYEIVIAPSATLAIGEPIAGAAPEVLAVGNPSFHRGLFSRLPELPASEMEASEVAASYRDATLLMREAATSRAFFESAPQREIVHFAGHAVVNERRPGFSALLFAPEPSGNETGVAYAHQIERGRFGRARLVVLAACETATGKVWSREGVMSLARSFLAAGVPQVVGTLWRVDDRSAREFFTVFHREVARGVRTSAALQAAQRARIASADPHPYHWAAFALFGRG